MCANMEDGATNARNVVGLVSVNTEEGATNARNVVGLVSVNTEDGSVHARHVIPRRRVESGLKQTEWSLKIRTFWKVIRSYQKGDLTGVNMEWRADTQTGDI